MHAGSGASCPTLARRAACTMPMRTRPLELTALLCMLPRVLQERPPDSSTVVIRSGGTVKIQSLQDDDSVSQQLAKVCQNYEPQEACVAELRLQIPKPAPTTSMEDNGPSFSVERSHTPSSFPSVGAAASTDSQSGSPPPFGYNAHEHSSHIGLFCEVRDARTHCKPCTCHSSQVGPLLCRVPHLNKTWQNWSPLSLMCVEASMLGAQLML